MSFNNTFKNRYDKDGGRKLDIKNFDIVTYRSIRDSFAENTLGQSNIDFIKYFWKAVPIEMEIPATFHINDTADLCHIACMEEMQNCCFLLYYFKSRKPAQQKYDDAFIAAKENEKSQEIDFVVDTHITMYLYRTISADGNRFCAFGIKELKRAFLFFQLECRNSDSEMWVNVLQKILFSIKVGEKNE